MPNLIDGSIRNAQMTLKSYDLRLGKREYVADLVFNTVLEQRYKGRPIEEGERIPKGAEIDVILGDGLGQQELEAPNLIGLDEESAMIAIIGSGLTVGRRTYSKQDKGVIIRTENGEETTVEIPITAGAVNDQKPSPGRRMRLEDVVDIWIYRPDSINLSPSLLDN